ncbi:LOW QUALITY PROTEIN: interferon gamma receptor 1-like [Coregonus clupeaformis]|uniref:LOW QUALITY PROTEIN: interferon gamma receptor 1-like n=1 Tax=Coregonus clupeaformis TaxID=59861 RepID=UPI001E1C85B1|nr:LOW QUALITY PROTEIN: interferon gamma receptor 1-like [Coregonus clupeaformis]
MGIQIHFISFYICIDSTKFKMVGVRIVRIILILVLYQHVVSYVPPPVNVRLICHNFHNVIYWNYSEPSLQPQFNVEMRRIHSGAALVCSNTSLYHCDVSSFTKVIEEGYRFILTAVVGQNTNSSEISFTYDDIVKSDLVDVQCSLDFPPVNISAVFDKMIKVQFIHPFHIYKHAIIKYERPDHKEFDYMVITEYHLKQHSFTCSYKQHHVCEAEIPVDGEMDRHCIKIKGKMKNVPVSAHQNICIEEKHGDSGPSYTALYIVIPIVVMVVIVFIVWLIYSKRTTGSFPQTKSLASMLSHMGSGVSLMHPERAILSEVQTGGSPLLQTPVDFLPDETLTVISTPQEEVLRLPIGLKDQEWSGGDVMSPNEGSGSSLEVTRGLGLEVKRDFSELSDYDCPHRPVIEEMSPGDTVTGYKI